MNAVTIADDFREAHDPHWVLKSAFQLLVFGLVLTEIMLAQTVRHGFISVAALLVIVAAHLMHGPRKNTVTVFNGSRIDQDVTFTDDDFKPASVLH